IPQTLSDNAVGEEVAKLQASLGKLGVPIPALETQKQVLGVGTRTAVSALQRRFGLEASGMADEATLQAIADALAVQEKSADRVEGRVLTEDGAVARGAVIRLYRHAQGAGAEKVGEGQADEEGFYAVPWTQGDPLAGQYEIRIAGADGKENPLATLAPSPVRYAS